MMKPTVPVPVVHDVVAIELPANAGPSSEAAIQSCELVLGDGNCRRAGQPGPAAAWQATVVWTDTAKLGASISIHHLGHDDESPQAAPPVSSRWTVREVVFSEGDPLEQRYRALGLLIVSHVVAASVEGRPPPGSEATPEPLKESPKPGPLVPSSGPWGMDLLAVAGPGLQEPTGRLGVALRGWTRPLQAWGGVAGITWESLPGQPDVTWLTGSLGLLLHVTNANSPLALEFVAQGLAQYVILEAENSLRVSERATQARWGLGGGADGVLHMTDSLSLLAGARLSYLWPPYDVTVEDAYQGEDVGSTWGALIGVRVRP